MKIADLRINAELEDVLDKLFMESRGSGSNLFSLGYKNSTDYLMVQCPYHKFGTERRPSAQFRKDDGLFYCHTCKEAKSLMSVITDVLHVDGRKWLVDNFDVNAVTNIKLKSHFKKEQEKETYLPDRVLDKYKVKHPYMYERKLTDEIIDKFEIGYDEKDECLTFPIRDEFGHLLYMATRSVNTKFFHYPSGVIKPLYGFYQIKQELAKGVDIKEIYVCESMLDALFLWVCGKYAVAMNGTGSTYQYKQLENLPVQILILATDNDDAGRRARERIKANVRHKIIKDLDYESYGTCKDVNDMDKDQILNAKITYKSKFANRLNAN